MKKDDKTNEDGNINGNSKPEDSRSEIDAMADAANRKDMSVYRDPESAGTFKLIGYLFNVSDEAIGQMRWDKLTHINYAFAIPTQEGTIRGLTEDKLVKKLISTAHDNKVKVSISVGGWSYNEVELEATFVKATNTDGKCQQLSQDILKLVDDYGFDGVDMDWEYPRKGISEHQYEYFMTLLRKGLFDRNKYLTAAVVGCGSTGAGITDYALDLLDWINVMAYDGDNGAGHSPFSYAVDCGEYWIKTRGVDKDRVVLGVPFYARPSWGSYADIVAVDETAANKDTVETSAS